jgi:hypothetical protein
MNILEEVDKTINGERQDQYGSPENNFQNIADYWNTYIQIRFPLYANPLTPQDVARMLCLVKLARMHGQKYKRDNWVDAIGYLAIEADRLNHE